MSRLNWARHHVNWGWNQWRRVLFTDESRVNLDFNDGRQQVWRQPGERYAACTNDEHDRYGGGSLMVWGGIWAGGRTDLALFRRGTLNAARYLNDVIRPQVIPRIRRLGARYLMDDNAPCYTARVRAEQQQQQQQQRHSPRLASTIPDPNPIKQAWDMLG